MTAFNQHPSRQTSAVLAVALLSLSLPFAMAGEVAGNPGDNGADILEDTTEDLDSHSSEVAAAVAELIDPVALHDHVVPLADAVEAAVGLPEPLVFLGSEIMPATAERLSWSAT